MLRTLLPMNWFQISEEIPSLLVIMSHKEWDSEEGGRKEKGGGSQTSVTICLSPSPEDPCELLWYLSHLNIPLQFPGKWYSGMAPS